MVQKLPIPLEERDLQWQTLSVSLPKQRKWRQWKKVASATRPMPMPPLPLPPEEQPFPVSVVVVFHLISYESESGPRDS